MIEYFTPFELTFILLFLISELLEIYWQHAPHLLGVLGKLYREYEQSIWIFLLKHMSYSLTLYLLIYTNFSPAAIIMVLLKSFDIGVKIYLLDKIFYEKSVPQAWMSMLLTPLKPYHFFLSLLIYLPLLLLAFNKEALLY